MAFTELNFLSRFLPLVIVLYYLVPRHRQTAVLFAGSMVFYALGDWKYLIVLLLLCAVNYVFSLVVWSARVKERQSRRQTLFLIVGFDAGVLIFFKILSADLGLALPFGISFYIVSAQ